jgi:N-acetylneuraminate lyase
VRIRGIVPALHTAFDEAGELDPGRQAALVERLIAQGVHGLFAGGSTGEFPLLSMAERERLVESVISAATGRVPVIAHAGAADTRTAVHLAAHAAAAGAAAVSCLPPFYYPLRKEEILSHYRAVAEAAAPLPFYAYHIPELTGVPMTPELLACLLEIPRFAGLKWSDPDLFAMRQAVDALGSRGDVLSGKDELCFPALTMGAQGAIGSTYNFLAPLFVRLWDAFQAGDLAEASRCQTSASPILAVVIRWDGGLSSGKEATRWAGVDCGHPRPPLRRYSAAERTALEREIGEAGLARGSPAAPPGSAKVAADSRRRSGR